MKVILYKNKQQSNTFHPYKLATVMEWIKEKNDRYPVTEFRKELSYCTARTAPDIIHKLPVILFTALFRKKGKTAQMQKYNGIVLLEFNHLADVQEIEHIKSLAAEIPQTLAAFTGSGGRLVKILVRFCYPDGQLPLTQEEALIYQVHAYVLAVQVYQPYIPFPIDFKEPLLERGCRFSYDPELYFAPDALPFLLKQPHEMPVDSYIPETTLFQSNPVERMLPGYDKYQIASTLYETSLQEVIDRYGYELPHDRKPFLTRLARNCQRSGVPEEDALWWTICRFHLYEAETEVRLTFRNTYAIASGAEEKPCIRQEQLLTIQLEEFMKRRYDFRFNTQTILVEYRKNRSPCFYYRPVNEQVLNSIALDALAEGLKVWDRDVRRHIYSDRIPHYSPLQHFLSQLPRWNQEDHISHLAATVPCSNPLWHRFFFRWFLAMVAQWRRLSTTHGNSLSPLLVGEQGTGKSTFCRKLLPPELRNLYTDRIDFSRKRDAEMALYRFGLINIDEFDQISVRNQGFLKHILQKSEVSIKLPYQSAYSTIARYASFIATSNHTDLLTDTSGSRRFICIEVTGKIDNSTYINYPQLYAQAVYPLQAGESYWLSDEENAALAASNEAFRQVTPVEQLFVNYFRGATQEEEGRWMMAIEILEEIRKRSKIPLADYKIVHFGRILKELGILSKRSKQGAVYKVVEVNNQE